MVPSCVTHQQGVDIHAVGHALPVLAAGDQEGRRGGVRDHGAGMDNGHRLELADRLPVARVDDAAVDEALLVRTRCPVRAR